MSQLVTSAPVELTEVVSSVFQTMVHLEAEPSYDVPPPRVEMITAAVYLAGHYQGALLLHCADWQACGFAGQYMGKTPPSRVDDDVLDVIGELANMLAGNLKGSLFPGSELSVPSVIRGTDTALRLCGSRPVQRAGFRTALGPFWVTMFASASNPQ